MISDLPIMINILELLKLKDIYVYITSFKVTKDEIAYFKKIKRQYIDNFVCDSITDFIPKERIHILPLIFIKKKINYDCDSCIDKTKIYHPITLGFDKDYNLFYVIRYTMLNLESGVTDIKYVCIFKHNHNLWSCTDIDSGFSTGITTFDIFNLHFIKGKNKGKSFEYVKKICDYEPLKMIGSLVYHDNRKEFEFKLY